MHIFDVDTAAQLKEENTFSVEISENWSINNTANGGYLLALLTNAMEQFAEKKSTPVVTANFMARCEKGPAVITVETIHKSSQFHRIHASIIQNDVERVRACGTFLELRDDNNEAVLETGPPQLKDREQCILIPLIPGYSLFEHMDVYLDPSCAGWFQGKLSEISLHKGWIRFKEQRHHDLKSIALFTDVFPPPVLSSHGLVAWVPTIEFTFNVRNIPVTEWCMGTFRTRFISNGICEEDGELWDEDGNLVAISRQISLFNKTKK